MDINNYIELLQESNRNRENIMTLYPLEVGYPREKNIKGIIFRNKLYSKAEYEEMLRQENDNYEKRIAKIEQGIQEIINKNLKK